MRFSIDKPIRFNSHRYPIELQGLLHGRPIQDGLALTGQFYICYSWQRMLTVSFSYMEEGTTTSPFDVRLHPYHVASTDWTRLDGAM